MESTEKQQSREKWTSARKTTEAAKRVRGLVKQMYLEGQQALAEGKPVAWVLLATGNNFIFKAMDIVPLMPENYGGLCATKRMAQDYIDRADTSATVCRHVSWGQCPRMPPTGVWLSLR